MAYRWIELVRKIEDLFVLLQDNQLEQDLDRLRYAVMDLVTRLARQFKHKRNGIIFLINNYTYLVQVNGAFIS